MNIRYLNRTIDKELLAWKDDPLRKPILLRGARQVGKSSSVRELGKHFRYYLEINFEEHQQARQVFSGDLNPNELCNYLSVLFNTPIVPGETLVFFDEIQACIPAISSLRFFYERMQQLHVIAAGSLLEFALEQIPSFGVGRIHHLFMYPFSFNEFLSALNREELEKAKQQASFHSPLHQTIHNELIKYLRTYLVTGGMPEVVSRFSASQEMLTCQSILDDLLVSLNADFGKYKSKVPASRLSEVFLSVARQMGNKFIYSRVVSDAGHEQIRQALSLLIMAGLVVPVTHSAANGIPLGAETDQRKRKMLLLDTGIYQRLTGLYISDVIVGTTFKQVNKGSIAELFAGLEILKFMDGNRHQQLYYWHREKPNSQAEVDFLVQVHDRIIPVEIKSGIKGAMQSMFLFLKEKNLPLGLRFSLENYSQYQGVRSCPLYAIHEVLQELFTG